MTIETSQIEEGNKCLSKLASLCEAQHPVLIASDNFHLKILVSDIRHHHVRISTNSSFGGISPIVTILSQS